MPNPKFKWDPIGLTPSPNGAAPLAAAPVARQPWWRALNREAWLIVGAASLAWLFDCLDQQFFNLARDGAMEELVRDAARATIDASYATSCFLAAWALGGLIFGSLGDLYGRARMLTVTVLLYTVCTGLSALSAGVISFCVFVSLTGLGVGGIFGLSVALVADSVPEESRAPALGLLQSLSTWGNIAAGFIGMGVGLLAARQLLPFGLKPWQALFLAGSAPALLAVLVLRRVREPARWVAAKREGAARGLKFGSYAVLLRDRRWASRAWLGLALCSAGIVGLWGLGNFHPKIVGSIVDQHLAGLGLNPAAVASEKAYWRAVGLLLQNAGAFCGMITIAKLAQWKGRRPALACGLVLSFLTTVLVFKFMREIRDMYWMLPLMGFGQLCVFAGYAIYLPELFPTSLRSTGTSFCYNFGRLAAASAPFTTGVLTAHLGGEIESFRTAGLWVSVLLPLGLLTLPFLPETKGVPLPSE